jgi:hypothetical protein
MSAKAQSRTDWPGAFGAVEQAFHALQRNFKPLLYYLGVILVCELIIIAITGKLPANGFHAQSRNHDGSDALIGLIGLILLPYLARYQLALARGKTVRAKTLLKLDLGLYFNLILALILGGLAIIGGALPLLIPLIWVIPSVSLLVFVVVDQDMDPWSALKESFRLSHNKKAMIWSLIGVTILLAISSSLLNFIPVIGILISAAVGVVSQAALGILYFWLKADAPTS